MFKKLTAVLLMSIMVLSGTVMSFAENEKNDRGLTKEEVENIWKSDISNEVWNEMTGNGKGTIIGASSDVVPEMLLSTKMISEEGEPFSIGDVRVNSFARYYADYVEVTTILYTTGIESAMFTEIRGTVTLSGNGVFSSDLIDYKQSPNKSIGSINPLDASECISGKTYYVESGGRGYGLNIIGGSGGYLTSYPVKIP